MTSELVPNQHYGYLMKHTTVVLKDIQRTEWGSNTIWENTSPTGRCIFVVSHVNPLFRAPLLQVINAAAIPLG